MRLGAAVGFVTLVISIIGALTTLGIKLWAPERIELQGWTSLVLVTCFFGGLTSFLAGLALEYLAVLLLYSQGQPTFLVIDRSSDDLLLPMREERGRTPSPAETRT